MSKNVIFVLMYYRHTPLDHTYWLHDWMVRVRLPEESLLYATPLWHKWATYSPQIAIAQAYY
jgi:hypothetical protein